MKELMEGLKWLKPMLDEERAKNADKVIQLIERDMPRRPLAHEVKVGTKLNDIEKKAKRFIVYFCPKCGEFTTKLYKHCSYCGQAFDWSDI